MRVTTAGLIVAAIREDRWPGYTHFRFRIVVPAHLPEEG